MEEEIRIWILVAVVLEDLNLLDDLVTQLLLVLREKPAPTSAILRT